MPWLRSIRSIAPWALGVFVLAQLCGLMPAHYEHAGVASGHPMMHAPSVGFGDTHHHALGAPGDECCAVHAMPLVPSAINSASPNFIAVRALLSRDVTFASARFTPLEPPPKLLPSA